jgi:hypothetical protein
LSAGINGGKAGRHRFHLSIILLAWFAATGVQWDFVQVFAWGRMFSGYSHSMSLSRALSLTLQPDNLCGICRMVKDAKQQQDQAVTPSGSAAGKAPLVFQAAQGVVVAKPPALPWRAEDPALVGIGRSAPPNPPPRAGASC